MPLIIHDYLGVGHDLSKGAFDSVSVGKVGAASKLLNKYLPQDFAQSWKELSTDYKTALKSYQPSMWNKMWTYLPNMLKAGAAKYSVGRPLIHKWIAGIAASDPAIGGVVAAAEVGLSQLLSVWGDQAGTTTVRAKKGQWIFIESEESHRRRRMVGKMLTEQTQHEIYKHKGNMTDHVPVSLTEKIAPDAPPNEKQPPKTKSVSLGFFIEPAEKNRVTVFSLDLGRALEIEISQLLECDASVAQRLDNDERLSTLREMYFYKYDGMAPTKGEVQTKPFFSGRRVRYNGESYLLLYTKHGKALLEDANGKTCIVDKEKLTRDYGDSTPGEYDNGFQPAGKNNLYSGQWVFVPPRESTLKRWATTGELAVIHQIAPDDRCIVFYALDGQLAYVNDDRIRPLNKKFQALYNAKKVFMWFRLAAIKGTLATSRYALGKHYAQVCIGRDYTDALTTETPYSDVLAEYAKKPVDATTPGEASTYGEKAVGPETGNNRKENIELNKELFEKGMKVEDAFEDIVYVTEDTSGGAVSTAIVGIAIAAVVYALYAA